MSITWRKVGKRWTPDHSEFVYVEETAAGATAVVRMGKAKAPVTTEFASLSSAMDYCDKFI